MGPYSNEHGLPPFWECHARLTDSSWDVTVVLGVGMAATMADADKGIVSHGAKPNQPVYTLELNLPNL